LIRAGVLNIGDKVKINSYHGSFVASYLGERLLETKQSFDFETVMFHGSKVDLLKLAHGCGYKTCLYFIFADAISTNTARVQLIRDPRNLSGWRRRSQQSSKEHYNGCPRRPARTAAMETGIPHKPPFLHFGFTESPTRCKNSGVGDMPAKCARKGKPRQRRYAGRTAQKGGNRGTEDTPGEMSTEGKNH
jgi:hypothetical protein